MSDINVQSSTSQAKEIHSSEGRIEMKEGAELPPPRPPVIRTGAPMYREQPNFPTSGQGALFPVHTIVVQPNQPNKRGNYSKAAAAVMNRNRAPPPSTYFIQHRRADVIFDEGPTVKQHLQQQQKQLQMKAKFEESMAMEQRYSNLEEALNGKSDVILNTTPVFNPTHSSASQSNAPTAIQRQIHVKPRLLNQPRPSVSSSEPARPIMVRTSSTKISTPLPLPSATQAQTSNNRKLKVIVSPGVSTSFTTAAQKQQLATASYLVSTVPLPPSVGMSVQVPTNQNLTVHPSAKTAQGITVQRTGSTERKALELSPVKKNPEAPTEYHVVKTITPSKTPLPPKSAHRDENFLHKMITDPPMAILEGEEEEIIKEQARLKEEQKLAQKRAYELHVQEIREREQRLLDQDEKERKEREKLRFVKRHQEQQKLLDDMLQQEYKIQAEKKKQIPLRQPQRQPPQPGQKIVQHPQSQIIKQQSSQPIVQVRSPKAVQIPKASIQQSQPSAPIVQRAPQHTQVPLVERHANEVVSENGPVDRMSQEQIPESFVQPIRVEESRLVKKPPEMAIVNTNLTELNLDDLVSGSNGDSWGYQRVDPMIYQGLNDGLGLGPFGPFYPDQTNADSNCAQPNPAFNQPNEQRPPLPALPETIQQPQPAEAQPPPTNVDNDPFHDLLDKDDSLNKLLTDDAILEGFTDLDPSIFDNFTDLEGDPLCTEKGNSSKRSNSPDIGMSLIDWISNDDHELDDTDDLLGLRDEKLENSASEYMNVCANVDFFDNDETSIKPLADTAAPPVPNPSLQITPAVQPAPINPIAVSNYPAINAALNCEVPYSSAPSISFPNVPPPIKTEDSKSKKKQITKSDSKPRERRSERDRLVKQKKAEMDALEKEREKQQIEADRDRIRRIMEKEQQAIEAEKAAGILKSGPSQAKKKTRNRNRNPQRVMPPKPVNKPPTPQPRVLHSSSSSQDSMPELVPVSPMGEFDNNVIAPGYDSRNQVAATQRVPISTHPPSQPIMTPALPPAPIVTPYFDPVPPSQFPPDLQFHGDFNEPLNYCEPPLDFSNNFFTNNFQPQQWFDGPIEQYFQDPQPPLPVMKPEEKYMDRSMSRDSGANQYGDVDFSNLEKKSRRSSSFTTGILAEPQSQEQPIHYDEFGNALGTQQQIDEAIVYFVTAGMHGEKYTRQFEKALLSGNDEALEKVIADIEFSELLEMYSNVPTEYLYSLLENPHEQLSDDELLKLRDDHGVDITEQLRPQDTNVGVEIPIEVLMDDHAEALSDYDWKRLLFQSLLAFVDEEKEDELFYMENQVYSVDVALEKHFACKVKVIKEGLLSLLHNNAAMIDEVSRLAGKLLVTTEERKVLARRLCHHQRNYIRRLQTASKRRSDAEKRRQELIAAGLVPSTPTNALAKALMSALSPMKDTSKVNSSSANSQKKNASRSSRSRKRNPNDPPKKRGRPFTKNIPPKFVPGLAPFTPSPKKKDSRTQSHSSQRSISSANRSRSARDRSDSSASRSHKKKKEQSKPIVERSPSVTTDDSKKEVKEDETVDVKISPVVENETRRRRPERRRGITPPVTHPDTPIETIVTEDLEAERIAEEKRARRRERDALRRKRQREERMAREAEQLESRPKRARGMKGYVYEDVPPEQEENPDEPETQVEVPDVPIGLRKSARKSAQHLNFVDFSPRSTPEPDDIETEEGEEALPKRRTARTPRSSSVTTPKSGERKEEKIDKQRTRRNRSHKESENEGTVTPPSRTGSTRGRSASIEMSLSEPPIENGEQEKISPQDGTPLDIQAPANKEGRWMRPRRNTQPRFEDQDDDSDASKKPHRTREQPVRQSSRRKS